MQDSSTYAAQLTEDLVGLIGHLGFEVSAWPVGPIRVEWEARRFGEPSISGDLMLPQRAERRQEMLTEITEAAMAREMFSGLAVTASRNRVPVF